MKTVTLLKTKTNLAGGSANVGARFSKHAMKANGHCETFLRRVQKAPDDIRREIDRNEFDELMATKGFF